MCSKHWESVTKIGSPCFQRAYILPFTISKFINEYVIGQVMMRTVWRIKQGNGHRGDEGHFFQLFSTLFSGKQHCSRNLEEVRDCITQKSKARVSWARGMAGTEVSTGVAGRLIAAANTSRTQRPKNQRSQHSHCGDDQSILRSDGAEGQTGKAEE